MTVNKKRSVLSQYQAVYEALVNVLAEPYSISDTEQGLAKLKLLTTYAWFMHPGRFVDLRLESWAAAIGQKIWEGTEHHLTAIPKDNISGLILHVATATYNVGGHTRLLLNVIKGDTKSVHSLVLTRQQTKDVPDWLYDAIIASGGTVTSLLSETYSQQVAELQKLLCHTAERVFYHIHPDDAVAVAALAALPRPQVLVINHADHVFWLGAALADVVVCFRVSSLESSLMHRAAQKVMLLPTPLEFSDTDLTTKEVARKELGIKPSDIIILTVASSYKFTPNKQYNYYRVIEQVLSCNPHVLVKVIGLSIDEARSKFGNELHTRIEFLEPISSPRIYYESADIYLDCFPMSSTTSLFEAMYFSCFPVIQFCPIEALNVENEPALQGLVSHATNEREQISFIKKAIYNPIFRRKIATEASRRIKNTHMHEGWKDYLQKIYNNTSAQVESIRNLNSDKIKPFPTTQLDLDAANLAHSLHGNEKEFLIYLIKDFLPFISIVELVRMYFRLRGTSYEPGTQLTAHQFAWLVKNKLMSNFNFLK